MLHLTSRKGLVYKLWLAVGNHLGFHDELPTTMSNYDIMSCIDCTKAIEAEIVHVNTINWGKRKGIIGNATMYSQFTKVVEELGELARAIFKQDRAMIIDAMGDVQVTLILLAEIIGIDYHGSLKVAYNEIANRKGKIVNETFVKEQE